MGNIVAIVGRPNVGKSTLYNRLIGERQAIIDDISGVTRDRQYGQSFWNGKTFTVVDTGGFVKNSDDVFEKAIRSQVQIAIDEASVIVFLTDVMTGITDLDEQVVFSFFDKWQWYRRIIGRHDGRALPLLGSPMSANLPLSMPSLERNVTS